MSYLVEQAGEYFEEPGISGNDPIRRAWIIIGSAFLMFCLLCIGSMVWMNFFFFRSTVRLDTRLQVGSGTIGIQSGSGAEQTETGTRYIHLNTTVRTDPTNILSQATITFFDSSVSNDLVATVTMKSGSIIRLLRARRPRFEFGAGVYQIDLEGIVGEVDIFVADQLERAIVLSFQVGSDVEVRLLETGRYTLEVTETAVILTNHDGVAVMIPQDVIAAKAIPQGTQGTYSHNTEHIDVTDAPVNLLTNSQLQVFEPDENEVVNAQFPSVVSGWQCKVNFLNDNRVPLGNYFSDLAPDGRPGFRLLRQGAINNVATGCSQELAGPLVSDYDELWLEVVLYVRNQSISGCGIQGSECPLMMQIIFEDEQGREWEWIHGVYASIDPALPWPLRCGSCRQDHFRVYMDTWYTYNSGNLFTVFPPDQRPAHIKEVSFYASGHDYDVYVNQIGLFARNVSESLELGSNGDSDESS